MVFADELEAFRAYADALPNNCIFLVDTYDTLEGVRNAIVVGRELRDAGHELVGIRLDSGDLGRLSIEARRLLDEAGFESASILASDRISEQRIREIKEMGGRVDAWGIGTHLVTAYDQPALGGVYKLSVVTDEHGAWNDRVKLSEETVKTSNPGIQQVRRFYDRHGVPAGDAIHDPRLPFSGRLFSFDGEPAANFSDHDGEDLLVPVFRNGKYIYESTNVHAIRDFSLQQQRLFDRVNWREFRVGLDSNLHEKKAELVEERQGR
jgi:nicotinate phosphoribosyltransferase